VTATKQPDGLRGPDAFERGTLHLSTQRFGQAAAMRSLVAITRVWSANGDLSEALEPDRVWVDTTPSAVSNSIPIKRPDSGIRVSRAQYVGTRRPLGHRKLAVNRRLRPSGPREHSLHYLSELQAFTQRIVDRIYVDGVQEGIALRDRIANVRKRP
jgi:hypothetical protein